MPAARIVGSSVQRADSLRSERSDASQNNKRVSFNRDVDVKHINQQQQQQQRTLPVSGSVDARHEIPSPAAPIPVIYNVYKEPTLLSEAELAKEAERIIQQVDQISCTVSPNPLLANYETRSLERRNLAASAKRNNNQQQATIQQQQQEGSNWSRTLPAASTKNLLDKSAHKKTKNFEKNNIFQQQQLLESQQHNKLDPIVELPPHQRRHSSTPAGMTVERREAAMTTPPKYDSGIEMEANQQHSRPNVNLIVQQLTEEARQRDMIRRQYQDELMTQDPLAPRLPALNLIEPDPQFGLTHNRNLPFSYTGGTSPTRISPLRSPGVGGIGGSGRFASPPPRPDPPGRAAEPVTPTGRGKDVVYAQVNRDHSPERNVYRPNESRNPFDFQHKQQQQQQQQVIRQHMRYEEEEDEPEEPVDDEDLDAMKAKARFLFGDDGDQDVQRRRRELDVRNNNNNNRNGHQIINNNNNKNNGSSGLSYKYSTLLKGQQQPPAAADANGRHYTTTIQIGSEGDQKQSRNKRQDRVFQYSDEDDFNRKVYKDRSVSPQPRFQPLTSRIRSLQKASSPERYRDQESRTLPLVNKKNRTGDQVMASTRLIQEAERGRTVIRNHRQPEFNVPSSRLLVMDHQQQSGSSRGNRYTTNDGYDDGPPKPPVRIKKLSRERMENSPPRMMTTTTTTTTSSKPSNKVAFSNTVPWNGQTDGSESSPERSYPLRQSHRQIGSSYRFQQPQQPQQRPRSITPSPERRVELRRWNNNEPLAHVNGGGQESDTGTKSVTEPEAKQEKIRRQRSKFLSVFLGSKANKSSSKSPSAAAAAAVESKSQAPLPPPVIKSSAAGAAATKDVKGQTVSPPVAKWSPEDEVELVRQSRSLLSKGHPATKSSNNNNNNNSSSNREPQRNATTFYQQRKSSVPGAADPRYRVISNKADGGHRRRSSTDRTDTSESDEVNHQRFKSLRQKSQSFNNLNYRPDPVLVLAEEQQSRRHQVHQQRHQGSNGEAHGGGNSSDWDQGLDNGQLRTTSRRYPDHPNHHAEAVDSRYSQQQTQRQINQDARPYASTNLIHQIGQQDRPAVVPAAAEEPHHNHRQMRYFGDTDLESQPSRAGGTGNGGYSSRYQPKANKVSRSASSAAGMGAVRRGLLNRSGQANKQPVGSVNSSESDGSAMQSAASGESQRSVYLHATTVADIPTVTPVTNATRAHQLQAARRKAQSREDMSALSGTSGSTLRRSRHISRSYSVLAPWKPRHYRDKFEITYSNQQQPAMMGQPPVVAPPMVNDAGKPPRVPIRRREDVILESEDSADVYRARPPTAASKTSVSRSSTMPKNSKLMAGWFRKKKQR